MHPLQRLLDNFEGTHRFHNYIGNLSLSHKPIAKQGGGGQEGDAAASEGESDEGIADAR